MRSVAHGIVWFSEPIKSNSWLKDRLLKPKQAGLTAPALALGSKPSTHVSTGAIPVGESAATTGRCRRINPQGDERLPSGLIKFSQVPVNQE